MKYLLDTNICIYIIKKKFTELCLKLKKHNFGDVYISSITVSELEYGVQKSSYPEKNQIALFEFLFPFEILDYTAQDASHYGRIRSTLEKEGQIIGPMDMLIASQALSNNFTVVTNNEKEFCRIKNLRIVSFGFMP